ncbi:MAG: thiol peroxidase [Lentisphaerae bacterium]|nr:thiol peroxidase [Lentisphaerota bacterium]
MVTQERNGVVTLTGKPAVLLGPDIAEGSVAPPFRVVDEGFNVVSLDSFAGSPLLISSVPSLDTSVCALQTKRFNAEIGKLKGLSAITVSTDLPFAQKRFCAAEKISGIRVLSDCVWREFGMNYGLLLKGMGLLARAVIVIGRDGRVSYCEIVGEISQHPDYDAALRAAGAARA